MPPRPKNLYLVYGWKVGADDRNIVLFLRGEEAMKLGISLTVSSDGQKFFVGRHLATALVTEGECHVGVRSPTADETAILKTQAAELGLSPKDDPMLYVVAG